MFSGIRIFTTLAALFIASVVGAEELPTCEAKIASYVEDSSAQSAPDLGTSDYQTVLGRGTYLNACGVPSSMAVKVCAAVQAGAAVGVTITTDPADAEIATCIREQVAGLEFPSHPKMDVVRTTFAADEIEKPRAALSAAPTPQPPAVTPKQGGCGCSTPNDATAPGGFTLAVLAGVLLIRRRPRW